MGALLAGLQDASGFDPRECDGYVGTSAGSIVAAALAAGVDPRTRLGSLPEPPPVVAPEPAGDPGPITRVLQLGVTVGGAAAAPLAAIGLRTTEAAGALMRRAALRQVAPGRRSLERLGRELEQVGASWDGRLSVAAVEVESGRRVMFGSPGAPPASVADAVQASCAIPGVFRPVVVDGRSYVDGGVWSPTNLDRAPAARGTRVLCLNPTGSMRPRADAPFGMVGPALARARGNRGAHTLERRGAQRDHGVARCGDTGRDGPEPHGCRPAVAGDRGRAGAGPGAGYRATGMSTAAFPDAGPRGGDAQDESLPASSSRWRPTRRSRSRRGSPPRSPGRRRCWRRRCTPWPTPATRCSSTSPFGAAAARRTPHTRSATARSATSGRCWRRSAYSSSAGRCRSGTASAPS